MAWGAGYNSVVKAIRSSTAVRGILDTGADGRVKVANVVTAICCGAIIYLTGLGGYALRDFDEALYANAARHVLDGYWLVPHLHWMINRQNVPFQPFLEKPPGGIWLQALSMAIFGVNEFSVRLPSAIAAVLCGIVLYFLGRYMFNHLAGVFAAIGFYGTRAIWGEINAGRHGGMETLHLLFGLIFLLGLYRAVASDQQPWLYVSGAGAVGAVFIKGFNAGIFLLIALPFAVTVTRLWGPELWRTVSVGVIAILAWPSIAYLEYGDLLVFELITQQVVRRAADSSSSVEQTIFSIPLTGYPTLSGFFGTWWWLMIVALVGLPVACWLSTRQIRDRQVLTSLWFVYWFGIVLVFFAKFGNHGWYFIPAVPAGTLAIGGLGSKLYSSGVGVINLRSNVDRAIRLVIPIVLVILLITAIGIPVDRGWKYTDQTKQFGQSINEEVPEGTTVYIAHGTTRGRGLFAIQFYARHPVDGASVEELNAGTGAYAVITQSAYGNLHRQHAILSEYENKFHGGLVLVRFESDPAAQSA